MKLKYNHNGKTESITLSKKKLTGKRIAVRHNGENFYAPLVDAGDATASNLRTKFNGKILAVRALPSPEIENILIAPPRVSVMQGQSATAIVSAEGNEAVAGLSFSIANNPTWITIADECILIQPSDNDQGEAIVKIIAKDTGSDASASAVFVAEALLRPIIESLAVVPPAVTVAQGSTSTAIVQAVANSAVGGLSYSLDGAPSWVRNDNDTIWVEPTTNDTGTSTVNVVAYDTNSSARADTEFVATAEMEPEITSFYVTTTKMISVQHYHGTPNEYVYVTLNATGNEAVKEIKYSTNFAQVMNVADSGITIAGNQATLWVPPRSITPGSERTISFTACDQTGKASKTITQKYIVYAEPKIEASLWRTTVTAGSSGNVTRTITISSSGSGSLYAHGPVPQDATLTFNDTLYSSADTVKGVLKIVYPKKSQATVSGAPTKDLSLVSGADKYFVRYETWIHEWSGAIGNMTYTDIHATRTIK